jgi:hypothetical protein
MSQKKPLQTWELQQIWRMHIQREQQKKVKHDQMYIATNHKCRWVGFVRCLVRHSNLLGQVRRSHKPFVLQNHNCELNFHWVQWDPPVTACPENIWSLDHVSKQPCTAFSLSQFSMSSRSWETLDKFIVIWLWCFCTTWTQTQVSNHT